MKPVLATVFTKSTTLKGIAVNFATIIKRLDGVDKDIDIDRLYFFHSGKSVDKSRSPISLSDYGAKHSVNNKTH